MSNMWRKIVGYSHISEPAPSDEDGDGDGSSSSSATVSKVHSSGPPESGLFDLTDRDDAKKVDVVAVHGLQGDAYKTWTHENGSMWLKDFLPKASPKARIMTYGYDSTVAFSSSIANIDIHALRLLNYLGLERDPAQV